MFVSLTYIYEWDTSSLARDLSAPPRVYKGIAHAHAPFFLLSHGLELQVSVGASSMVVRQATKSHALMCLLWTRPNLVHNIRALM
jgi:hypothetical protein